MAFSKGTLSKVLAQGWNLSTFFRSLTISSSSDVANVETFGDNSKEYLATLKDATASLEGLFDGAANAVDAQLDAVLGASANTVWTFVVQTDVIGGVAYGINAVGTAYEVSSPVASG